MLMNNITDVINMGLIGRPEMTEHVVSWSRVVILYSCMYSPGVTCAKILYLN